MKAFVERRGVSLAFAWGFSEATLFFFVPDVAVGAVALFGLRRGLKAAGAAVAGAVLGGVAMWLVARGMGGDVRDLLTRLPGIPDRFFGEAREGILADGGVAVVRGPGRGIPYKVYAAEWALADRGVVPLALWTVPARALRIGVVALVAGGAGAGWRRVTGDRWTGGLLALYGLFWVLVYAAYFADVGW